MNIRNLQNGTDAYRSITDQITTKRPDMENQPAGNATENTQPQQTNGEDAYIPSPEARRLQDAMESLEQQRMNRSSSETPSFRTFNTYDPKSIADGTLLAKNINSTTSSDTTLTPQNNDNTHSPESDVELGRNIDYKG